MLFVCGCPPSVHVTHWGIVTPANCAQEQQEIAAIASRATGVCECVEVTFHMQHGLYGFHALPWSSNCTKTSSLAALDLLVCFSQPEQERVL